MKSNTKKVVFIIGNGFDLDLGWKTKFSQFADSEFWPKSFTASKMNQALLHHRKVSDWFDLEQIIALYASRNYRNAVPAFANTDKQFFNELKQSLSSYLVVQQESEVRADSAAARLLKKVLSVLSYVKIYSFNYTDLNLIASKLGYMYDFSYEHIHGKLKDGSLILGIPESTDVVNGYEFLYKTFSKHYSSHEILYDILDADEVIFFGHSLGPVDYHYFQQLFKRQCRADMDRKDAKRITIFTYDDESRLSIMKQLREMNEKRTDLLYNRNLMNVLMTDGSDDEKINKFIDSFDKRIRNQYSYGIMSNAFMTY